MGTSRSGSVGSGTRWKVTRGDVKAIADSLLVGAPLSIPQMRLSDGGKTGRSIPPVGSGAKGAGIGMSIPQSVTPTSMPPRSIRELGKRLVGAASEDNRFALRMGDCAVKVAIEVLIELFNAATMKYTQRDIDKLFAEYGISGARNVAIALPRALDQRYREELVKKCKKATDNSEKARIAMQDTLINLLSPDGTPQAFRKLNADGIYTALRKTNSMKIVERFYANYLKRNLEVFVASLDADISTTSAKNVVNALNARYCDPKAREIVKRAREKGWRASEIPDKADEWDDLLVEDKEVPV